MIRVIVTGGHDVDESEFFRRDNALRHAHVRFVRTRIFLGQRIGEVRIREEVPSFPLKEKAALAQPPQMQGFCCARCIRDVCKNRLVPEDRPDHDFSSSRTRRTPSTMFVSFCRAAQRAV